MVVYISVHEHDVLLKPSGVFAVENAPKMDLLQEDEVVDIEEDQSETTDGMSQSMPSASQDQMERCGRWLLSIPRQDVGALQQTQEYSDFIQAFERLARIHTSDGSQNQNFMSVEGEEEATGEVYNNNAGAPPAMEGQQDDNFSFLQIADDDIIVRAFDFLECQSLVKVSRTCARFRELAHKSAGRRTYDVAQARQLNNVMMLLRAKEQIDGIGTDITDRHVRVPVLLLGRRVIITDASDPEYNGIYFCTGSNGNGFIFTKPRFPERRIVRTQGGQVRIRESIENADQRGRLESEVAQSGQLLRCIIAKRFSNEVSQQLLAYEVCCFVLPLAVFSLTPHLCCFDASFSITFTRQYCGTLVKKSYPPRILLVCEQVLSRKPSRTGPSSWSWAMLRQTFVDILVKPRSLLGTTKDGKR